MAEDTLHIVIDPSGAQRGSMQTVQALNSIVNATNNLNIQINVTNNKLDQMGRAADRNSKFINKLRNGWILLKSSMLLAIPLKLLDSFIDKMISVDRSYQNFMASMYVSTNSTAKSKEAFDFVARAARAYGVELETISKSYAKFRAAVSSQLPTAAIDRLFLSVTAVSSVLHLAPQSVDRMFTAFTQMASKGQLYSEELKQQLGEHLPGAVALAAQAMGVSVKQLMNDMKAGKADIVKFFSNMPDVIMEKFGEAAKISALSIIAQINNLKSTIYRNFVELNNSGAALGLAKFIQSIDNILQPTTEHFKAFGKVVGEAFLKAADFVNSLTPEEVADFATQLVEASSAMFQLVTWFVKSIVFIVRHGEAIVDLAMAYGALRLAVILYSLAAIGSVAATGVAAKGLGLLGKVAAAVALFFAGWQIGTVLKNKFLSVELFGIALTKKLTQIVTGFVNLVNVLITTASAGIRIIAEGAVNGVANMGISIANMIPGVNFKTVKVDLGGDDAAAKAAAAMVKSVSDYKREERIFNSLADDAIARRIASADTTRVDEMTKKYGSQIEEIQKLQGEFEKMKAEAEAALKTNNAFGQNDKDVGGAAKKAKELAKTSRDTLGYLNEVVSNLKTAYTDKVEELNQAVEAKSIAPSAAFKAQEQALKDYASNALTALYQAQKLGGLNAKQREDINGKILGIERFYVNEMAKIHNAAKNDRKQYLESMLDYEIDMGAKRLTKLEEFAREWSKKYKDLKDRVNLEGDQNMIDRFNKATLYGEAKASYRPSDEAGYSEYEAAFDLMNDHNKMFSTSTSLMLKSTMGEYENYFRDLRGLVSSGTLDEAAATKAHNDLMASRSKALTEAAVSASQARLDIGQASNFNSMLLFLDNIRDGFLDLKTEATNVAIDIGKALTDNISSNLADVITGAKTLGEAFNNIAGTILNTLINAIIKMGVQWAAQAAMSSMLGKASAAESTATAAASGAAITASMAPAAAATSLATMGGNTITASTGMLAFGALMAAMLGGLLAGAFDNGGYIPDGKLGIVGEYGPEIVQGPVAVTGRKTTESILSSASGQASAAAQYFTTINVAVNVSGDGQSSSTSDISNSDLKAMGQQMAKIAEQTVYRMAKPGGFLDGRSKV